MKKLFLYLAFFSLVFGLPSCEDDNVSPTFSVTSPQSLTAPADGANIVFTEATEADAFEFSWTAASLNPTNLPKPFYRLQMDFAGNDFSAPMLIASTSDLSYSTTVMEFNSLLVGEVALEGTDTTLNVEFRVIGNIEGTAVDTIFSEENAVTLALYKAAPPADPVVYLLGSATAAGWDNTLALPFTPLGDGVYEIVTELAGGEQWKIIETLGMWAPQWGWDETGDPASGGLSYRPTEADPDPMPVIAPAMTGSYKITIDLVNLTYTVVPFGDIWIVGPATPAGWDNTLVIPFSKVDEDQYTLTIDLVGGEQWKILDEVGMWAPQWGWDETGDPLSGGLSYRPTEADPDPMPMTAPAADGLYKIDVDIANLTYTVTPQ